MVEREPCARGKRVIGIIFWSEWLVIGFEHVRRVCIVLYSIVMYKELASCIYCIRDLPLS